MRGPRVELKGGNLRIILGRHFPSQHYGKYMRKNWADELWLSTTKFRLLIPTEVDSNAHFWSHTRKATHEVITRRNVWGSSSVTTTSFETISATEGSSPYLYRPHHPLCTSQKVLSWKQSNECCVWGRKKCRKRNSWICHGLTLFQLTIDMKTARRLWCSDMQTCNVPWRSLPGHS